MVCSSDRVSSHGGFGEADQIQKMNQILYWGYREFGVAPITTDSDGLLEIAFLDGVSRTGDGHTVPNPECVRRLLPEGLPMPATLGRKDFICVKRPPSTANRDMYTVPIPRGMTSGSFSDIEVKFYI